MPHNEFQSVSRMKENFTYGLTGRDWKSVYDLVNKSLRNRKGGATGYQVYEIRRQSFTLLVVLTKILIQSIQQLAQLKNIYSNARDQLRFVREINSGINDALGNLDTTFRKFDPQSYENWFEVQQGLKKIEELYGNIPDSKSKEAHELGDMVISEALTLNSNIFEKTEHIQDVGERIQDRAFMASPKGAQKVTAEGVGVMVHLLNESLKAQSHQLKLSAQTLAIQNSEEKNETALFLNSTNELKKKMGSHNSSFNLPRF